MTVVLTGWILCMIGTTLYGVYNNHKDISIPFTIVMLAGVLVIGVAGMFSIL